MKLEECACKKTNNMKIDNFGYDSVLSNSFVKVLHLSIRILTASVKITSGGRAPVDSMETKKE